MINKIFIVMLSVLVVSSVFFTKPAFAQSVSDDVNQRLNSYVSKYGVVLDDASAQYITQHCQNTQANIRKNQLQNDLAVRKRIDIYTQIQNEIRAIELRMMRQGADTSELDLLIGKIQSGQDRLTLAADNYGTAADDVLILDCQRRPEQFKGGTLELNSLLNQVRSESNQLQALVVESPTTTFNPLMKRLSI
jgi:putative NADH-flavin reductase